MTTSRYRLTLNETFASRAIEEMVHVCTACADWNPSHFLDTAEMTHAVGIGYDWLYSVLTSEQRTTIESGALKMGLDAGITAYKEKDWFTTDVYVACAPRTLKCGSHNEYVTSTPDLTTLLIDCLDIIFSNHTRDN